VILVRYLAELSVGKLVLWCYLCWYIAIAALYFDNTPTLWLSSVGMSAIVGTALVLSTVSKVHRPDGWAIFRLFLMPFCVSSYAALIKGKGFVLIFPPVLKHSAVAAGACAGFLLLHFALRPFRTTKMPDPLKNESISTEGVIGGGTGSGR
jgi:hypothetical protein